MFAFSHLIYRAIHKKPISWALRVQELCTSSQEKRESFVKIFKAEYPTYCKLHQDMPACLKKDLLLLHCRLLDPNPTSRPTAKECVAILEQHLN